MIIMRSFCLLYRCRSPKFINQYNQLDLILLFISSDIIWIWNKTSLLNRLIVIDIQKRPQYFSSFNAKLTCRAYWCWFSFFFWMINWFRCLMFGKTNNTSKIWSMCVHYRINFTIWYISVVRTILMSVICRIDLLNWIFFLLFFLFSLLCI